MNNEEQVKELLGEKAYNMFLDAVESGEMNLQQMTDIAVELHAKVGGKFKLAKDSRAFQLLVRSSLTGTNMRPTKWTNKQLYKSSSPYWSIKTYNSTHSRLR